MSTNITDKHKKQLALIQHHPGTALFSCFYDGKPAVAIVVVTPGEGREFDITPVALLLTDEMTDKLTDHDGEAPNENP